MKKTIFLSLLFFSLGFLTHALFFPDILANGITDVKNAVLPNPPSQNQGQANQENVFMTKIDFDGERFSRNNITVQSASYLIITNTSKDKLMWLDSNNPLLATKRGYGESEAIRQRMDKQGQFVVIDKNNPDEKLVITVK
jgi:hypothetical protein